MSVFSSLISYRPKRKGKHSLLKISSPFHASKPLEPPTHLSPTQVLDIYHDREHLIVPSNPVLTAESPKVELSVSLDAEPLTDWFSANFPKRQSSPKGGDDLQLGQVLINSQNHEGVSDICESGSPSEANDILISAEELLTRLQTPNSSHLDVADPDQAQYSRRKATPSSIKICRDGFESKIQIVNPGALSRPTSVVSTSASSVVSGTSLARALIANSFVLSETRSSRYRSGTSMLARADSATLPLGDFPPFHRRERSNRSSFSSTNSPPAPHTSVPPVPNNAGKVYEPPRRLRMSLEALKRQPSLSMTAQPKDDNKEQHKTELGPSQVDEFEDGPDSREHLQKTETNSRCIPGPEGSCMPCQAIRRVLAGAAQPTCPEFKHNPAVVTLAEPPSDVPACIDSLQLNAPDCGQNLDIINYYASGCPEVTNDGFYLPFSPITEESSSQLSPPTPYDNRLRAGLFFIGRSPTPANGSSQFNHHRHFSNPRLSPAPSQPADQLNSYEKDGITTATTMNFSLNQTATSVSSPSGQSHLLPTPVTTYSDKRGGYIPSPIKLVPDPHDPGTYNITVNPSPTSGASDDGRAFVTLENDELIQTLPKSPSVFGAPYSPTPMSPMFSSCQEYRRDDIAATRLQDPSIQTEGDAHTRQIQQALLTQADASVHGARFSMQSSFPRDPSTPESDSWSSIQASFGVSHIKDGAGILRESPDNPTSTGNSGIIDLSKGGLPDFATGESSEQGTETISSSVLPVVNQDFSTTHGEIPLTPGASPFSSSAGDESSLGSPIHSPLPSAAMKTQSTFPETVKVLPPIPFSHDRDSSSQTEVSDETPFTFLSRDSRSCGVIVRTPESRMMTEQLFELDNNSSRTIASVARTILESESKGPEVITSLLPQLPLTPPSTSSYSDGSLSPPPYQTVITRERLAAEIMTSTGLAGNDHSSQNGRRSLSASQRGRARPAGPRKPSQQQFPGWIVPLPERSGSTSSLPSNTQTRHGNTYPTLDFETPAVKIRPYGLEAAKWTFTSRQLQQIVSCAIRTSAEPSWIRLLSLDTVEDEIPDMLKQLETRRNNVKQNYQTFSTRRHNILESLTTYLNTTDLGTFQVGRAATLVDDLKDVSTTLDNLAEELNALNEQHAQISQLYERHFTSALAMALRKLNDSFLKRHAEIQSLCQRVEELEAECDEAWRSAEQVAAEYDQFQHAAAQAASALSACDDRSSMISALRRKSLRVSRAGLRPGTGRSSMESSRLSSPLCASPSELPSMPRSPSRHRPEDIMTTLSLPRSSTGVSTVATPTSETKAMIRAQQDLYEMLGMPVGSHTHVRRSRSVIGIRSEWKQPASPHSQSHTHSENHHLQPTSGRLSLPTSPTQPDAFAALARDIGVLLTSERSRWI